MSAKPHQQRAHLEAIARRVMVERGLLPDFAPAALAELARLDQPARPMTAGAAGAATAAAVAGEGGAPEGDAARDLRSLLWCSIDNDDSRDLDQLSVAEALPEGAVKVLVAIADVDTLVHKGSAIDQHAEHNTTSVYTAARIFPMLPEKLSTDLTSLAPDEDRLSLVIELTVGKDGAVPRSDVYRAWVRNHAKLAYDGVGAWLEGKAAAPRRIGEVPGLDSLLRLQDQAAQRLRELRHERGALELETLQARPVFQEDEIVDLQVERGNRAKELIEDFMIAANGATAAFLTAKGFPSLRRVVRNPKRWPRIVEVAAGYGEHLPPEPDAPALAGFLVRRRQADPLRFPDLSLSVVKLLGAGEYVLERPGESAPGHFGLAVRDYTHSTAPNRRYPDLITQRLLKAALAARNQPYTAEELEGLAAHCTEQEDAAQKVERQVEKSAAAMLLESRIGQSFDGVVTGASEKGTWARIFHPPVEGRIVHGWQGLDVGDKVRVRLVATDADRGYIDFAR
jgi:VacB/RNase II family 3'-5' exoribonuclease